MGASASGAAAAAAGNGLKGHLLVSVTALWCLLFVVISSSATTSSAAASTEEEATGPFLGINLKYPIVEAEAGYLPKPEHVVDLLKNIQIHHIKLQQNTHPSLLQALSGSGIEVLVTVPNQAIQSIAKSQEAAAEWLQSNVLQHYPATSITGIVVGDEVLTMDPSSGQPLVKAMKNLHSSVVGAGLENRIKISTSHSMHLFTEDHQWGHQPSSGAFRDEHKNRMQELLDFLAATGSYFMINVDPLEVYEKSGAPLDFTTLSAKEGVFDSVAEVTYTNLLDAAVDSAYNAMEKLGTSDVPVVVGAIGWPWKSARVLDSEQNRDLASSVATTENAALFNENLVKRILSNVGTPKKPGTSISAYILELFDVVRADDTEQELDRFGLFSSSQIPRYRFDAKGGAAGRVLADVVNGTNNFTNTGSGSYCIAKPGASDNVLSVGLNWACGQGNADCTPIQQNGACYLPDTYANHASYAFNAYYQKNAGSGATCDFGGAATLTSTDPSYGSCIFTSSTGSSGGGGGGTTTGGPSSSNGIIQPFNPSGNNSAASTTSFNSALGATLVMALLVWSWRF